MLLTIDAGNTNIVFALHDGEDFGEVWRCQTIAGRTADEYAAWLYQFFTQSGRSFADVGEAIISSVVPDANYHLETLCRDTFSCDPILVTYQDTGLPIKLDKPSEIGADRLVNAVAIVKDYRFPAIVIDFGTATTFDVIDADGAYIGGAIAPGINLSASALHQAAAKLPKISIARTEKVIGTDTISAMQSGVFWGYVGMIEGVLGRMEKELGRKPFVIATGGLAHLFAENIPAIEKIDNDLTLRGLAYIYEQKKRADAQEHQAAAQQESA